MNQLFAPQSDHPLFRYFTASEREQIEGLGSEIRIARHGYLIRESQIDSTLFAIEEGRLEIMAVRDGEETILANIGPGDVLGEVSFIDESPRSVSVRAGEETVVRAWTREALLQHLRSDPQLLAKFSVAMNELLVERLRDAVRRRGNFKPV
jgi:CRP-like cAMP-binding protein